MNINNNFEKSVTQDYVLVKHVNAKTDKKIITAYTLLSFVPLIILMPVFYLIAENCSSFNIIEHLCTLSDIPALFIMCFILIAYAPLHEIVHGITYKLFTGAKLKFGITLTVAFCGVPDIYVRKKASIASLLMPFTVFSIVFMGMTIGLWFVYPLYGFLSGIIFAIHLGGCVGDLHWALMYLTKFRHCNTLMRDTGPEQWLYIPQSEAEKYNIAYDGNMQ